MKQNERPMTHRDLTSMQNHRADLNKMFSINQEQKRDIETATA